MILTKGQHPAYMSSTHVLVKKKYLKNNLSVEITDKHIDKLQVVQA